MIVYRSIFRRSERDHNQMRRPERKHDRLAPSPTGLYIYTHETQIIKRSLYIYMYDIYIYIFIWLIYNDELFYNFLVILLISDDVTDFSYYFINFKKRMMMFVFLKIW